MPNLPLQNLENRQISQPGVLIVHQTIMESNNFLSHSAKQGTFPFSKFCCVSTKLIPNYGNYMEYFFGETASQPPDLFISFSADDIKSPTHDAFIKWESFEYGKVE